MFIIYDSADERVASELAWEDAVQEAIAVFRAEGYAKIEDTVNGETHEYREEADFWEDAPEYFYDDDYDYYDDDYEFEEVGYDPYLGQIMED